MFKAEVFVTTLSAITRLQKFSNKKGLLHKSSKPF
jgi:hypothetical protein